MIYSLYFNNFMRANYVNFQSRRFLFHLFLRWLFKSPIALNLELWHSSNIGDIELLDGHIILKKWMR